MNPTAPIVCADQYELKLQMAGISQGYERVVIRGAMESDSFAAFYLQNGIVIAVDNVNRAQDFLMGKKMVAGRMRMDPSALVDESIPLKSLVA